MPSPGVGNVPPQGLALQNVPSNDAARIQRSVHNNDLTDLERYLLERNGQGLSLPDSFMRNDGEDAIMVCFAEDQLANVDCQGETLSVPLSQQRRVLGLPVMERCIFSKHFKNKRYTFAKVRCSEASEQARRVFVPSMDSFHVERGDDGELVIDVCRSLRAASLEGGAGDSGDLVILNDEGQDWSSVKFRRVRSNNEAMSFVLDMIIEEDRRAFCAELDEKGWNSLHWTCYQDDHETLNMAMDKLKLLEQHELMTATTADDRGWTLLHCAAVKNAGTTLTELMKRFPDENIRWRCFSSKAADGKTALHLAVAEQNVKAVIVLLDEAANLGINPLHLKDNNNLSPADLRTEDSLLGKYVRSSAIPGGTSLHELAKRDDELFVSFRLSNFDSTTMVETINCRNSHGLTVLHAAIEARAWNVLKLFMRLLSPQEFESCIRQRTTNGDLALHMLARSNEPVMLHMSLQHLPRETRLELIQQQNAEGRDVLDVGESHKPVMDVVKFHRWLLKQELRKFFENFRYSLFQVEISSDKLQDLYSGIENRTPLELGYRRNINYDANKCVRIGDLEKARGLIDAALEVDPLDIHALCNLGVCHMAQGNFRQAEQVAIKVLDAYTNGDGKQRLNAGVDYAYWLAEVERTYNGRQRSCEIFRECMEEAVGWNDARDLQAYCSYFYTKVLVRWVKDEWNQDEEWYKTKFDEILNQLVKLSYADRTAYGGEFWLWLAEMQSNILHRRSHADVQQALGLFELLCHPELDCSDLGPLACITKAQSMRDNYAYDRKFLMRVGKISLDISYEQTDPWMRTELLRKALNLSENCSNASTDWYFMCASTSAQALLQLWAIEFYGENQEMVHRQYQHRVGVIPGRGYFLHKAINFLVTEYHNKKCLRNSRHTAYLFDAARYLQQIIDKSKDGWMTHGIKYARVMHLLGSRNEGIVDAFQQSLQALERQGESGRRKYTDGLQSFGLFYELNKDFYRALYNYDQALGLLKAAKCDRRRSIASRGMALIEKYQNGTWQQWKMYQSGVQNY